VAHATSHVLLFWFNSAHPGYLDSQDTFYAGTIKGVGRFYQQTFIDTYFKWLRPSSAKLHTSKVPITAADLLNDRCYLSLLSRAEY
jgi:hypothetical protein